MKIKNQLASKIKSVVNPLSFATAPLSLADVKPHGEHVHLSVAALQIPLNSPSAAENSRIPETGRAGSDKRLPPEPTEKHPVGAAAVPVPDSVLIHHLF
jgi:hypothetical protein